MMRSGIQSLFLAALVTLGPGCAQRTAAARPQIEYGVDACDYCRMTISERTWASVALDAAGREARFDDLHCLAGFLSEQGGDWKVWVHAVDTDSWVDASTAWFGRQADRVTPMGSGWSAYADRSAAESASAPPPVPWERFKNRATETPMQTPAVESGAADGDPNHTS